MKTLGTYIRERREEMDLSLREFARKLGRSAAFVSDIELSRRFPSDEVLADIAKSLRTSVETLRQYDTRPPIEEIKRFAASDPRYALAFRTVIQKNISPEDLLELVQKKRKQSGQKTK
jgi:transcriptional regulator with XRE-family HTH domain